MLLRIEMVVDLTTNEDVMRVAWPDRPAITERFADADAFLARVLVLEQELGNEQWTYVGSPGVLPHNWRGEITD